MLSYRWFALGVGFGRSDWQWFRVNNVGPRSVLVLDVLFGGGFNLIFFYETTAHPYLATTEIISSKNTNAALKICVGTLNGTSLDTQIHNHSRPRRVVAQNPKISVFRKNQVSSCGSILTLFFSRNHPI